MTYLRIAAVQLNFQPSTRNEKGWRLEEPLSPSNPLEDFPNPEYSLDSLSTIDGCRQTCRNLTKETYQKYVKNISEKIKEILNYCYSNKVDLVVFPEYAVPVDALQTLLLYSTKMAIVAGLGYLRRSDISQLEKLNFDVNHIKAGNNVSVVLTLEDNNYLVTKKIPAQNEGIVAGSGPEKRAIHIGNETKNLGVAICLDFPNKKGIFLQNDTDIVAIPALSTNIQEFNENPREFIRVFANHTRFGGTFIGIPHLQGLEYKNDYGTIPLERGIEGIVIVDWDSSHEVTVPKALGSTKHKIYALASLIYSGREPFLAKNQKRMEQITSDDVLRVDDVLHHASNFLSSLDVSHSEHLLPARSLKILLNRQDHIQDEEILFLTRHCILSEGILTDEELQYLQCLDVEKSLKRLQERITRPEKLANPYVAYEKNARELSSYVRTSLLAFRHIAPTIDNESELDSKQLQLVIFARLGAYSEEAIKSLPRQLTLLRAIADSQDPTIKLHYRIYTEKNSTGIMLPLFDVICTTNGKSQTEIELLREGLGQVIHIAFTGAYSISYATGDEILSIASEVVKQNTEWWAELQISDSVTSPYLNIPDWGMVIDLLRSLSNPAVIELQCSALADAIEPTQKSSLFNRQITNQENTVNDIFGELLNKEGDDRRRLKLRIFLGSAEELPPAIISSIGIEITGSNPFTLKESPNPLDIVQPTSSFISYSPVLALAIFHPPFGNIYATANLNRDELQVPTNEPVFPTGIVMGKSHVRHVRADEEIEVRISDDDRLKHTYIIGKTGSGKTNLLKLMASQDVQTPGRGVTIIDPHGDLVDYVLRQVPQSRADEVILIDLTKTDALPILNPLSLGENKHDLTVRDRTIQELILLLTSRIYHEWAGPRFEEIVRLVFETMLDQGYPVPASFTEVSGLLMDRELQGDLESLVVDPELKKRWDFQDTLARDSEYGGVIHWITSKFADISRDSTLRCVMGGGESTLDIEEVVNNGGILLVRIPDAVIGKQAADFIGSLILLQLRMAIIRRREFGKLQHHHFVYVDEFQNFATTDFHTVVAEARKFNIGFTLAHQNLEQLREFSRHTGTHDQRLINAILGNVGNIIVFNIGMIDAEFISRQLGVHADKIMKIGRYQALAKILVNGYDTDAFTLRMKEAKRLENPRVVELVQDKMRRECWIDPQSVYAEINTRLEKISQAAKDKRRGKSSDTESGKNPLDVLEELLKDVETNTSSNSTVKLVETKSNSKDLDDDNSLENLNIFDAMGTNEIPEDEKEETLDLLQECIWQDFLESDVELLITSDENKAMQEILGLHHGQSMNQIPSDVQEKLIDYLESLIPDLEDIMVEKALDFKEDLLRLRISILRKNFEAEDDILVTISEAQDKLDNGNARQAINLLNGIPESSVNAKSAIQRLRNQ